MAISTTLKQIKTNKIDKIMGMDIDYIAGNQAIQELGKLLSDQEHGEREEIADEIIEFVEKMKIKWNIKNTDISLNEKIKCFNS